MILERWKVFALIFYIYFIFLSEIQYGRRTRRHLDLRLMDQKFPVNHKKIDYLDTAVSKSIRNQNI